MPSWGKRVVVVSPAAVHLRVAGSTDNAAGVVALTAARVDQRPGRVLRAEIIGTEQVRQPADREHECRVGLAGKPSQA